MNPQDPNIVPVGNQPSPPPQNPQPLQQPVSQQLTELGLPQMYQPQAPVAPVPATSQNAVPPPATQLIVDTSKLFAPDNPVEQAQSSGLKDRLASLLSGKRKLALIPIALVLVGMIGFGVFKMSHKKSSVAKKGAVGSSVSGTVDSTKNDAVATTAGQTTTSDAGSTAAVTGGSGSSSTKSKKSAGSSSASAPAPAPAVAPPTPQPIPQTVTCKQGAQYDQTLSPDIINQVTVSINAALAGKASDLTSWVPAQYRNASGDSDPNAVNSSFSNLGPTDCSVLPIIFADSGTAYSSQGITLYVKFSGTAKGKAYFNSVNVALVSGSWKTDVITTARPQ